MTEEIPPGAAPESEADDRTPPPRGLIAAFRRRSRSFQIMAVVAAFLVLATGSLLVGVAVGTPTQDEPDPVDTDGPPLALERERPGEISPPLELRSCSVHALAADEELSQLHAAVLRLDAGGSELLLGTRADAVVETGGVMKLYTAAAALAVLGPDYRISTTVAEGANPGSVVLIGRGDATLSRLPAGTDSVYPNAPRLDALAAQTVENWGLKHPGVLITELVVDSSYWSTVDGWGASWPANARADGTVSRITALQVDGDRNDPTEQNSRRSDDPIERASSAFAAALLAADPDGYVVDPALVISDAPTTSGSLLAEVQSQPIGALVTHLIATDDNTLAETLARIVSLRSGMDGSSGTLGSALAGALSAYDGLDTTGLTLVDGSGLSPQNRVSMAELAEFLGIIQDGERGLSRIRDALAVAGESRGLATRFTGTPAVGKVFAKTGRIATAAAMAGIIEAADGSLLAFAVSAARDGVGTAAWAPMDALVTGFYECGTNLAPV